MFLKAISISLINNFSFSINWSVFSINACANWLFCILIFSISTLLVINVTFFCINRLFACSYSIIVAALPTNKVLSRVKACAAISQLAFSSSYFLSKDCSYELVCCIYFSNACCFFSKVLSLQKMS